MARPKGSKNKNSVADPPSLAMSTQEKITFLANLIVDRILEDQKSGKLLGK